MVNWDPPISQYLGQPTLALDGEVTRVPRKTKSDVF